jgi:hypothetical protein
MAVSKSVMKAGISTAWKLRPALRTASAHSRGFPASLRYAWDRSARPVDARCIDIGVSVEALDEGDAVVCEHACLCVESLDEELV